MQVLEPSTYIAHYCLLRQIARGGMSHVYLAQDIFTEQLVAMKLVDRDESDYCERLQREIRTLVELTHDHILPALDYGSYHSWSYLVMPYIEHGTLREQLAQGPLTPQEAGRILEQVSSALHFAHEHGIIHRDVKPSNILLQNGEYVYLTDFGLVKQVGEDTGITQTECMLGTPTYMAPELVEHAATISSDIYALGIVLYQMLTGDLPFKSETPMGVYWKHRWEQPLPPSMRNSAISPAIDAVVLQALEKKPLQRFGTVREFAQAYQQALAVTNMPKVGAAPFMTLTSRQSEAGPPVLSDMGKEADSIQLPWVSGVINAQVPAFRIRSSSVPIVRAGARKVAAVLVAVLFFFVTPLWLGFTFYSLRYHSQIPAIMHDSTPLNVGHMPALLHFPPVPPLHTSQTPPAATDEPQPQATFFNSSHRSPPPYKHRHKHKHGDDQEQEHKDHNTEAEGQRLLMNISPESLQGSSKVFVVSTPYSESFALTTKTFEEL